MWRITRYHFIVPMLRNADAPNLVARGAFWGMLIAMTPTVGIQIAACCAWWAILRAINRKWDFNLLVATAWTGVTNFITAAPFYYLFLITGQLMTGHWSDIDGFSAFETEMAKIHAVDAGFLQTAWLQTVTLFEAFGVPMIIGSIPWAILTAVGAYYWSHRFMRRVQRRRSSRILAARAIAAKLPSGS